MKRFLVLIVVNKIAFRAKMAWMREGDAVIIAVETIDAVIFLVADNFTITQGDDAFFKMVDGVSIMGGD